MGAIIEFLFANPFILIILIGLIYSMFFRKSPTESQPGNRPPNRPAAQPNNRMPNFGSPVMPPKTVQHAPVYREEPNYVEQRPQLKVLPGGQEFTDKVSAHDRPNTALADEWVDSNYSPGASVVPAQSSVAAGSRMNPIVVPESLTKDDLARAIVWSEILGPPRAKRPYRR